MLPVAVIMLEEVVDNLAVLKAKFQHIFVQQMVAKLLRLQLQSNLGQLSSTNSLVVSGINLGLAASVHLMIQWARRFVNVLDYFVIQPNAINSMNVTGINGLKNTPFTSSLVLWYLVMIQTLLHAIGLLKDHNHSAKAVNLFS